MGRNLIVCSDGTWNTPTNKDNGALATTNIYDFHQALAEADATGTVQKSEYRSGVGGTGFLIKRGLGGAIGYGISQDIRALYQWLCETYQPDDNIFLVGFSRGAYTVRSLAGMIGSVGIYDLNSATLSNRAKTKIVSSAYDTYKKVANSPDIPTEVVHHSDVKIRFLGVFDTVGALGIPEEIRILRLFQDRSLYMFHDTELSQKVQTARHAVAIDEQRETFTPTLWTKIAPGHDVEQIWFPGVHADIGGGYVEVGLSDIPIQWMMQAAEEAGLQFKPESVAAVKPDPNGELHDSLKGLFKRLSSRPRSIPLLVGNPVVHPKTAERDEYRVTTKLNVGQHVDIEVSSEVLWSETGVFLEAGATYELTASGTWKDSKQEVGPAGIDASDEKWGHRLSNLSSNLTRKIWKIDESDPSKGRMSRRDDTLPWFALIGTIANGQGTVKGPKGELPAPHQSFLIGTGCTVTPQNSGYLYGYANDLWRMYWNNEGAVALRIKRLQ